LAFLVVGFALVATAASLLPKRASAFWPFSLNANASTDTVVPSSVTPVLSAPTNSDPNASRPLALDTSGGVALVAHSGPSGTAALSLEIPPPDRISVYVARPGDTLSEIAAMYGVSINTIIWANNLSGPSDVHPGDTLVILPVSGTERVVVQGDTLKSIAAKYGADATEIAQYNGLSDTAPLTVGSTIIIPGGEISTPKPAAAPSSTKKSGSAAASQSADAAEPYLGGSGPAIPGYFTNPLPGGIITQSIHGWNAVDIGAHTGTPILAAAAGTVIISKSTGAWDGGYGNYVVITHGNGTQTLYAHMQRTAVSPGQTVSAGQVIGYVGLTGLTTGAHLHFEVRGAKNPFASCPVGRACSPK
jgi:murein DD-endopeptidase MepM/ murein hydrolase activator NlpD